MRLKVVQTVTGSGLAQGFSILLYLFAARTSGPEVYGAMVGITTLALFLSVAANAGAGPYLTQGLASRDITASDFASSLWARTLRAALLGILVFAFGLANGDSLFTSITAASLVPVSVLSQCVMVVPRSLSRFALAGVASALDKGAAFSLLFVLNAFWGFGAESLPLALLFGALVGSALVVIAINDRSYYVAARATRRIRPAVGESRLSSWYYGAGLIFAVQSLDVLALRAIGGATAAGEYAAVSKWGQPFALILSALNLVTLTSMAAASSELEARRTLRRSWPLVASVVCIAGLVAFGSSKFVEVLLGPAFTNSGPVLCLVMIGAIVSALAQGPLAYFQARRRPAYVVGASLLGVLAQFITISWLAASSGALAGGAAWVGGQVVILLGLAIPFLLERPRTNLSKAECAPADFSDPQKAEVCPDASLSRRRSPLLRDVDEGIPGGSGNFLNGRE